MTDDQLAPDLQLVERRLAQAYAEAIAYGVPDGVLDPIRQAKAELGPDLPEHLVQCPACGRTGLPESIRAHDCPMV